MMKLTVGVTLIALMIGLVPLPAAEAQSRCSRADVLELRRRGASWGDIEDICGDHYARPAPRPQVSVTCVTMYGACPMMEPVMTGSNCVCFTAAGPIPGRAL